MACSQFVGRGSSARTPSRAAPLLFVGRGSSARTPSRAAPLLFVGRGSSARTPSRAAPLLFVGRGSSARTPSRAAPLLLGAAICALVLVAGGSVWARSASGVHLDTLADEYYWAQQERDLRPSLSDPGNAAWIKRLDLFARRLRRIETANLSGQQRITHAMLSDAIRQSRGHVTEGWILEDLNAVDSLMSSVYTAVDSIDKQNVNDWRWTIKTLERSGRLMKDYARLLDRGIRQGRMQPADVVRSSVDTLSVLASEDPRRNPLLALQQQLGQSLAGKSQLPDLQRQLRDALKVALSAHAELKSYLKKEYLPRAPRPGATPDRYSHHVERYLGPGYDPAQLASWGRREVQRLHGVLRRAALKIDPSMRSLPSFIEGLDRHKDSTFDSGPELMAAARRELETARGIASRMVPLPRGTLELAPVPKAEEKVIDAQYFSTGPTSGVLQLNTGPLRRSIGRDELPSYITHEGYGGHHVQTMYALRQTKLPGFRQGASVTAFDEGWAVYAESWRDKHGGYTPPQRIGYLVSQIWAAALLVVDVGLHTGSMTRAQAERYMADATFVPRKQASADVERLLNFPGHGLTYYVGQRELLQTRREVRRILGKSFDERRFHSKLLELGSVPPKLARQAMTRWARQSAAQRR